MLDGGLGGGLGGGIGGTGGLGGGIGGGRLSGGLSIWDRGLSENLGFSNHLGFSNRGLSENLCENIRSKLNILYIYYYRCPIYNTRTFRATPAG